MAKRTDAPGMIGFDGGRLRRAVESSPPQSMLTRAVSSVFTFARFAEFEILFVLFFLTAFIIFKDLASVAYVILLWQMQMQMQSQTSRPEYNDILVKKPGGRE